MIRALVTGTLHADPVQRTSQNGNSYTTGKLRADGKEGATVWCSLIAFGDTGERLATFKAGAAIAVSGRVEVTAWADKSGNPAAGLSLVVDEVATLKGKPRVPQDTAPATQRPHAPHRTPRQPEPAGAGIPFDDLDDWQP